MHVRLTWISTVTRRNTAVITADPDEIRAAGYDPASHASVTNWIRSRDLPQPQIVRDTEEISELTGVHLTPPPTRHGAMRPLEDRISADGITAEAAASRPPKGIDDWGANWYCVTLHYDGRTLETPFGMGPAHTEEPTAADVLNCLASDATGYEVAASFEDWASDYGYDTDSRRAYAMWQRIAEQSAQLRDFLGEKADAYLYETEML